MKLAVASVVLLTVALGHSETGARPPNRSVGLDHHVVTWSPDGRELVYLAHFNPPKDPSHHYQERVRVDGTGRRLLFDVRPSEDLRDADVRFSRDGRQLAVALADDVGETGEVWVASSDARGARRLAVPPEGFKDHSPEWAPDGTRIAFVRSEAGATSPGEIWVADSDGANPRRAAAGPALKPLWSPDGGELAYTQGSARGSALFVVSASGGQPRRLTPDGARDLTDWAPDGARLLFAARAGNNSFIWSVGRDGRGERRIGQGQEGRFSSDGRWIAFRRGGLWVMRADGSSAREVFRDRSGHMTAFAWAPDSTRIAVSSRGPCDGHGVYIVPVPRGPATRLTNDCRIVGTSGGDRLRGTRERDVISGGAGNDRIDANPGDRGPVHGDRDDNDWVDGGPGADVIGAARGPDILNGGPGNDRIDGGRGADRISGGPGADRIQGGHYHDRIAAGRGNDTILSRDDISDFVICGPGFDVVLAERGDRIARDCERVIR
jgi:Tol biopolymer transport system component